MSKSSRPAPLIFFALAVWPIHPTLAQDQPLAHTFVRDREERYQVTVTIHIETHGISSEKIGERAYANFFAHQADGQVSWRSVRRISSLKPDGSAAISETLDSFQTKCEEDSSSKTFDAGLQKSVQDTCASWQNLSEMDYEEEKFGLVRGLPDAASEMIGSGSPLLSLWVRHAFRPSVILPKAPFHFGERTAHRIEAIPSTGKPKPQGEESMEWLEAAGNTPAATLHVSQNLTWIDSPASIGLEKDGAAPNPRHLFYADSLNTISLLDGSLLKASRSATHETRDTLDPVPGLADAPAFGSKLTITVTMLRLP